MLRCLLHGTLLFTPIQGLESLRRTTSSSACGLSAQACPGSPVSWANHASCIETRVFHNSCEAVQEEIETRIKENADRKKLPGQYLVLATQKDSCTKGSRATSPHADPGPFTDHFGFLYTPQGEGCLVTSCSESQVPSKCDFSTNFCNMFNLFCNEMDGCESYKHSLGYEEAMFGTNCNHGDTCGGWENKESECTRR
eukprot:g33146.t1